VTHVKELLCFLMNMIAHVYYIYKIVLQLSELVTVEGYSDWIRLVAEFTLKSLQSWQVVGVYCFQVFP
jgi:hypothetical protein